MQNKNSEYCQIRQMQYGSNIETFNKDDLTFAYIEELDEILPYKSCTDYNWHINGCPQQWVELYSRDKYIGSGYIVGHDVYGNLVMGNEKSYFYG